jgi:pimeloyl-ACP methyl ester carboxylesterase
VYDAGYRLASIKNVIMKKILLALLALTLTTILLLPRVMTSETQDLNDETRKNASGSFVTTAIGTSHVAVTGPDGGQPVVLVHGFSSPMYVWDNTAPALAAAGFKVIRLDSMGRGYSDKPDVVYDADYLAEQINQVLDALTITKPVAIVGYSMGGPVTAQFVIEHPERVAKVAFIAPFNTGQDFGPVGWPVIGDWLAQVAFPSRMPSRQSSSFYQPERFPRAEEQFREQMVYKGFIRAIHSSLKSILSHDQFERYTTVGNLEKPTMLLWGKHDVVVPYSQHKAVFNALNAQHFLALEKSGHAPAIEEPEVVNAALVSWLKQP